MSEEVAAFGVLILGSMIAGWVLAGVVMYVTAQIDERKWRRRMADKANDILGAGRG